MKILVTGSAGFIGSAVCSLLLQQGHTVYGIDNFSKYGIISRSHDNHINYKFTKGDCKDSILLTELIDKVDVVVHTAASIGGIHYWNTKGLSILIENEHITLSLFNAWIKSSKRPKMIIFSSSQVYESCTTFPSVENQELISPTSGYGLQKLLLEQYALEAHKQHGLIYTILRPFNSYGIGELKIEKDNHVITDLIYKIKNQQTIEIFGNGDQIRTFTYIDDVANAVLSCIDNSIANNKIYNVCSNDTVSINELVNVISTAFGKSINVIHTTHNYYDVAYRKGSYEKIYKDLGWQPLTSLSQGINYMVNNA